MRILLRSARCRGSVRVVRIALFTYIGRPSAMDAVPDKKPKIFVSYRREETRFAAGFIARGLASHFGDDRVVYDVDALNPGLDFHEQLEHEVTTSDFVIAVIGKSWLNVCDQ